ncbi:MAG: SulP family inorganic anion transporter, partial [Vibrio metschnikovii]
MPGLYQLKQYEKVWLLDDVRAAFSVVAVALPVAIAYAQLTGVSAIVGLYSCVLPMMVYALFGTSRQLIVGPDAATCAVVAAVVTPLAAGDPTKHWQLVITMTAMTGFWCLIASRFRLGLFADFLSRPILLGLLNGVALTIIVGQLGKVFGIKYEQRYLLERIIEAPHRLLDLHWQTVLISGITLLVYWLSKRFRPAWPAAMLAIVVAAILVWFTKLDRYGVSVVGVIEGGLPIFQAPAFNIGITRELVVPALNLAVVSFVSMMLTARSFAAKNGYDINPDKEFRALGLANLASAFSQGFAISGADSRTAVNDANGGKSQLVSIIAAVVIGFVAIFLYQPLQYIPSAALGVVLII